MSDFVHLHLHTQYSLLDGAIKVKDLVKLATKMGYSAIAMTDHGNLFGAVEFYNTLKESGLKPIIGMEAYINVESRFSKLKSSEDNLTDDVNSHIVLIAKDNLGFKNLMTLSTRSYTEGLNQKPRIDFELLEKHSKGIIALTSCIRGIPGHFLLKGDSKRALEFTKRLFDIFGEDLYLELQNNSLEEQKKLNSFLIEASKSLGAKLVATNNCHYLLPEDNIAHQVLLAIQTKKTLQDLQKSNIKFPKKGLHFLSPQEAKELFRNTFDGWERSLLNTVEIAEKVSDKLELLESKGALMPDFGKDKESVKALLRELSFEGLKKRIEQSLADDSPQYWERLEYELEVVSKMGFEGYFLIVQDFINWAKSRSIPVGPGRGSAAGSLLAFCLGITDVDPIKHGLLFERFLNPERVSLPDIDVDFCMERRDEVINYVREKYSPENVCQIITYNVIKAKQTIRDTARALGISYKEADELAKLVPQGDVQGTWLSLEEMAITDIDELLNKYGKHRTDIELNATKFRALCQESAQLETLLKIALKLEGLTRHTSLHAAGVVIAPQPLKDLVPLYVDKDGQVATQYDMVHLEHLGFIKMDFLGLKTLTELERLRKLIEERHNIVIDYLHLPLDDVKVFELLRSGKSVGVFQLESSGMRALLKRLEPDKFDDIVAVLALYRPGPLKSGLVDAYINRKHGRESIEYPFEELEQVLKETYGVWVYQEQIMKASQILAGFSPGEADTLRKAIGKKKADLMQQMKEKFIKGALERNFNEEKVRELWDDIEKFASYSFNKSHSVAYGYLSYWTAYVKAHYPTEFFCVKLSTEKSDKKFINLAHDLKNFSIKLLPPDINKSQKDFSIASDKAIRFGLSRIKGVGEETAEVIVSERKKSWTSISDFVRHFKSPANSRKINKKVLEALIKAGAFDWTGSPRSSMLAAIEKDVILPRGLFESNQSDNKAELEREVLGFYISYHPLDPYEHLLKDIVNSIEDIESLESKFFSLAGVVSDLKIKKTQGGRLMATFDLIDKTGIAEVVAFPQIYEECVDILKEGHLIAGKFSLENDDESEDVKLVLRSASSMEDFISNGNLKIRLIIPRELSIDELKALKSLIYEYNDPEGLDLQIEITHKNGKTLMQAGPEFKTKPSKELLEKLRAMRLKVKLLP
ncbi:MAG: DNA polymerase III subunit alpha [Aquificaceae bacterium]|nr:DNA polymerase III subunit alpha [Aquificaceae bacterium]